MTDELEIFDELVARIIDGTYENETSDQVFLDKCKELKEDAEIYSSLHPDKSGYYLIQRKLIVYKIIAKITSPPSKLNKGQKEKLKFIEKGLLELYWLYMELLVEREDY